MDLAGQRPRRMVLPLHRIQQSAKSRAHGGRHHTHTSTLAHWQTNTHTHTHTHTLSLSLSHTHTHILRFILFAGLSFLPHRFVPKILVADERLSIVWCTGIHGCQSALDLRRIGDKNLPRHLSMRRPVYVLTGWEILSSSRLCPSNRGMVAGRFQASGQSLNSKICRTR